MPTDYECPNCKLGFSVGFYHQHAHSDGYFGNRLLVCRKCGCQHSVRRPHRKSRLPFVLASQPDIITNCERRRTKLLIPFADYQNPQIIDGDDLESIACQRCNAIGCLVDGISRDEFACPNCSHSPLDQLAQWMT